MNHELGTVVKQAIHLFPVHEQIVPWTGSMWRAYFDSASWLEASASVNKVLAVYSVHTCSRTQQSQPVRICLPLALKGMTVKECCKCRQAEAPGK